MSVVVSLGQPATVWPPSCVMAAVWVGALRAWVLDVGVLVDVLSVRVPLGSSGWPLLCTGRFLLARGACLVAWRSAQILVLGLAGVGGWGCVSSLCAPGVWWIGSGWLAVSPGVMVGSAALVVGGRWVWQLNWCASWAARVGYSGRACWCGRDLVVWAGCAGGGSLAAW